MTTKTLPYRLGERSEWRAQKQREQDGPRVMRCTKMSQLTSVNALADYLQDDAFDLRIMGNFTYSNKAVDEYKIFNDEDALADFDVFLNEIGYQGRIFGAIEYGQYRCIPHHHYLMQGHVAPEEMQTAWKQTRGSAKVGIAQGGAFGYIAKKCLDDGTLGFGIVNRLGR